MPLPCYLLLLALLWGVVCRLLDALPLGMLLLFLLLLGMLLWLLFLVALLLSMLLWLLFLLPLGMLLRLLFLLLLGMLLLLSMLLRLGMLLLLSMLLLLGMLLWLLLFLLLLGMLLWLLLSRLGLFLSVLCQGRNNGSERQEQGCCSERCKCFHGSYLNSSVGAGAANGCILLTTREIAAIQPLFVV